ncbi:hypothetical protein FRX31_022937 [Thalictrum thalictroides]|uniref:Uncharacterized protein n=1 Tax=Thalictrum thalictroides TaxID=46969 RepID=A0A7J6VQX7_THATH|nr:hypothetical protein FRX31_022937 [Thalictrum thalictroides]
MGLGFSEALPITSTQIRLSGEAMIITVALSLLFSSSMRVPSFFLKEEQEQRRTRKVRDTGFRK